MKNKDKVMRVREKTFTKLRNISRKEDRPMTAIIDAAVELYEKNRR